MVSVKFDFDGLNVLNDIALVCCTDVVSSMKGQLISSIDAKELVTVPSLTCQDNVMTLVNSAAASRTKLQVSQLLEKSRGVGLELIKNIYDDRVRSLTPSSVRVRFANDSSFSEFTEKVDVALRVVRSSLRHGFFTRHLMRKQSTLLQLFPDPVPLETVTAAVTMSGRCVETLGQVRGVIAGS